MCKSKRPEPPKPTTTSATPCVGPCCKNDCVREKAVNAMKTINGSSNFKYPHNTNERMFRMSQAHWDAAAPSGRTDGRSNSLNYSLKAGVKPSEAINSVFAGADPPTVIECLTAVDLAWLKGILDCFGADEFDKMFSGGIIIKPNSSTLAKYKAVRCVPYSAVGTLKKGDLVYFFNHPDYLNRHRGSFNDAFQGENALVIGPDQYEGFGVPPRSEMGMKKDLLNAYNQMPTRYDLKSKSWVDDPARYSAYPPLASESDIPGLISPKEGSCKGEMLVVSIDVCKP